MRKFDGIFLGVLGVAVATISGGTFYSVQHLAEQNAKTEQLTKNIVDCLNQTPPQLMMTAKRDNVFKTKVTDFGLGWIAVSASDANNELCLKGQGRDRCSANTYSYGYRVETMRTDYSDDLEAGLNPRVVRSLAMQRLNYCVTGTRRPAIGR